MHITRRPVVQRFTWRCDAVCLLLSEFVSEEPSLGTLLDLRWWLVEIPTNQQVLKSSKKSRRVQSNRIVLVPAQMISLPSAGCLMLMDSNSSGVLYTLGPQISFWFRGLELLPSDWLVSCLRVAAQVYLMKVGEHPEPVAGVYSTLRLITGRTSTADQIKMAASANNA